MAPGAQPPGSWLYRTLGAARAGSDSAFDELFAFFRPYLLDIANKDIGPDLRPKYAPSDAVQETFIAARADVGEFRGETTAQVFAWLRQILLHRIADAARRSGAGRRDVGREVSLDGDSGHDLAGSLPGPELPPDAILIADEDEQSLRAALEQLPSHHTQVIILRARDGLAFEEIGRRLGRTPDGVRMLFKRAVEMLRELLKGTDDK